MRTSISFAVPLAALGSVLAISLCVASPAFAETWRDGDLVEDPLDPPPAPTFTTPIQWARSLVTSLRPESNEYGSSPSFVTWPSADGTTPAAARTMCNSFFSALLAKTYGFNETFFRFWTGAKSPTAAKYFEVMSRETFFKKLNLVTDIRAGDVLFLDYGDSTAAATGHIALLDATPSVRFPQSAPLVDGMIQYEVPVIDSTRTGHGPTDTRRNTDGTWNSGVGRGVMRLYVNGRGEVAGYAWSVYPSSTYAINGIGPTRTVVARFQL